MKDLKEILWVGSSLSDLRAFPEEAREEVGYALFLAQQGKKSDSAKPLKGFGGARVLEIVESYEGNAYRAVYTAKFAGVICVLHAFQKKSKSGAKTPKHEMDLIDARLKRAEMEYLIWRADHGSKAKDKN